MIETTPHVIEDMPDLDKQDKSDNDAGGADGAAAAPALERPKSTPVGARRYSTEYVTPKMR